MTELLPVSHEFDWECPPDPCSTDPHGHRIRYRVVEHAKCWDDGHGDVCAVLDVVSVTALPPLPLELIGSLGE